MEQFTDDTELWKEMLLKALEQIPDQVKAQTIQAVVRKFTQERTANNPYVDQSRCVLCHPDLEVKTTIDVQRFRVGMKHDATRYSQRTYFLLICQACAQAYHVNKRLDVRQSAIDEETRQYEITKSRKAAWKQERQRINFENQTGTPASNYWYLQSILTSTDVETLRTMPYRDFLQTRYWKTIRRYLIWKRHGCELCSKKDVINIHHRTYEHRGSEVYHLDDLIVLCHPCHAKFHDKLPQPLAS